MTKRSPRRLLQYEHRSQPILPRAQFVKRILGHISLALSLLVLSLALGVLGYHSLAGLSWIDALMNAAMILGGMGPVNEVVYDSGKLFATFYALYSGVAFLAISAVLIAPFAHRLLHRLHLDDSEKEEGPDELAHDLPMPNRSLRSAKRLPSSRHPARRKPRSS